MTTNKHKQLLDKLIQSNTIWQASKINQCHNSGTPTGFSVLDQHLSGAGWPKAGLTEILQHKLGIGELRLFMPALAKLSQEQDRWLLWIAPPYIPYAPALANMGINLNKVLIVNTKNINDSLWVFEKALASQSCSAVLAWPDYSSSSTHKQLKEKHLRRLQVACKNSHSLGVLFRHPNVAANPSPAELRILLQADTASILRDNVCLRLNILKRKGGWPIDALTIQLKDQLNQVSPNLSELTIRNQARNVRDLGFPTDANNTMCPSVTPSW